MSSRATTERIHTLLDRAAEARQQRVPSRCLALLGQAHELGIDSPDRALAGRVAWRLAKAAYDFGTPEQMLDAVTPLLAAGEAFAHRPGLRAMAPVAKRWWDQRGYADDRIPQLWLAWSARYRADEDPWMASMGDTQRAWHLACAGRHDELDAVVERYLAMDPRRFGNGPHRHPDAPDTPASVWWVQLELCRIGLWSAAWSGRRDRARDLADAFLDAAEGAEIDPRSDPWILDPLVRVGLRFDERALLDAWFQPWRDALAATDGDRAPFHLALGTGLRALLDGTPPDALHSLDAAVALARREDFGAEWTVDALLALATAEERADGRTPEATLAESARLRAAFGLGGLGG